MQKVNDYAFNIYSQYGEDGIIQKIFSLMPPKSRVCIEFGAWDGIYLSNTANLWRNGWKGILIEADSSKFPELVINTRGYDCFCINQYVTAGGDSTLEKILAGNHLNEDIDFLSIDVDGDDYYIFESLQKIRPRVIACEYNPTIPYTHELIGPPSSYFGCSPLSLCNLAKSKGYRLVAVTDSNCFFIDEQETFPFLDYETSLEVLRSDRNLTYLISGYDGDYVFSREPAYGYKQPSNLSLRGAYYRPPADKFYEVVMQLSQAHCQIAALLMSGGRYQEAKARAQAALEINPNLVEARSILQRIMEMEQPAATAYTAGPSGSLANTPPGRKQAEKTFEMLLGSENIVEALEMNRGLIDQNLLELVMENIQVARRDGNAELVEGLGLLADYISGVLK